MGKTHARRIALERREVVALLVCVLFVAGVFLAGSRTPLSSAETQFVEFSKSGLQIVPASCPSSPHYSGQCSTVTPPSCSYFFCEGNNLYFVNDGDGAVSLVSNNSCRGNMAPPPGAEHPSTWFCSGNDLYFQNDYSCGWNKVETCPNGCSRGQCNSVQQCTPQYSCQGNDLYYRNAQCQSAFVQACAWGCSGGGCVAAPAPQGNITASPSIVRQGETSQISWTSQNTTSCTVSENNPDFNNAWTGTSGSQTSGVLRQQTVYTLRCTGTDGSTLVDAITVNIIPIFEEQ